MSTSAASQTSLWPVDDDPAVDAEQREADVTHHRISEKVKVYALYQETGDRKFPHDKLRPTVFIWRNREYQVKEVTYVWREIQGQAEVYHYTVTDGTNVFELAYNAKLLDWTISGVYGE